MYIKVLTKRCNLCKKEKPRSRFHKSSDKSDGLNTRCKACINAKQRHVYTEHAGKNKRQNYRKVKHTQFGRINRDLVANKIRTYRARLRAIKEAGLDPDFKGNYYVNLAYTDKITKVLYEARLGGHPNDRHVTLQ
jgi:hypothetical protein